MGLRNFVAAALMALATGFATPPAHADDAERGEALFGLCAQCHGSAGAGNALFLAPAIAGMEEWYVEAQLKKFRAGTRGTHFDDLSGMRMRPMSRVLRSEEDVSLVARHVAGLPKVNAPPTLEGGDAARGAALYPLCSTCHGVKGEGLKALNGPALAAQSDWYMLDQLKKFKLGIRGSNPQDIDGIMMRPMSLSLTDDQAIKDVIAHIKTLE
jgi:cytochrome c553